jgi:integrase
MAYWRRVWLRVREGRRRKVYCLQWYNEQGRMKTEAVGADKRLAERLAREGEHELNNGLLMEVKRVRLEAFRDEHLRLVAGRLAPATIDGHEDALTQLRLFCGDVLLEKLTPKVIEEFVASRLKEARPATANKDLRTLKSIFTRAQSRGYLLQNPCKGVKPVREPEGDIRALSVEEIERLLVACEEDRMRLFVFLALTTGMRRGELCALEWDDVDLEGGIAAIRNKVVHRTKSGKIRWVPLVPDAVSMLRRWKERQSGRRVFETENGEQVGDSFMHRFRTLVRRAGIKHCCLHDLRRTFVSHLAMAGISEVVAQKLVGHAGVTTTQKYYTGILPEALKAAPERLPYSRTGSILPLSYRGAVSKGSRDRQLVTSDAAVV